MQPSDLSAATTVTLDCLAVGQVAEILEVQGQDAIAVRMLEMGLVEGEPIWLLGQAPLGDPLEFSLRGYRISLRRKEARRVRVRLLPQPTSSGACRS
ncbi:MAG: iron transporter [Pirellulaceae bacterium]|nr:MAG: iron transporter [Pirellulaceae bacterium]